MSSRCPACAEECPPEARFCPACGATIGGAPDPAIEATRTSTPQRASDPAIASSLPSEDGARFPPGTRIGERYRIVGLLGRGGMGEVYRADDLKLGRTVALKFLPESMERDPGRLNRFLNEVRTAVRVTHPNVCRVHDVGEIAGRHYLSMEYVDGEDLGTLLRRIGRLPAERAVRAARQLCSGLAAAHEQGVLHRDLKPANVMIDGRGEVKITDFGLASAVGKVDGDEIRAGTPAYMAPEQFAGREVGPKSDLYALGLVLYELFSGKPAFPDTTPAAIARRAESTPTSLTSVLDDVDPAVARVVDRCLSSDPSDRPTSAMAVLAALPGGDPLAAALAAGETPSPALVAEAGASEGLTPARAWTVVALIVVFVGVALPLVAKRTLVGRVDLDRPPAVLEDRARELLRDLGHGDDALDRNRAWYPDWALYREVRGREPSIERWDALSGPRPVGLLFAYRESPQPLVPSGQGAVGNWMGDPPNDVPGMTRVVLTPSGTLRAFHAVPPAFDDPERTGARNAPHDDRGRDLEGSVGWAPLFEAANLDPSELTPAEPRVRPPFDVDRRVAWVGHYPERPDVEIRVEAASVSGRPVAFAIVEPWAMPSDGDSPPPGFWAVAAELASSASFVVALVAAGFVAFRNIRLGRGDHRTALRFGLYLGALRLLWILDAHHIVDGQEIEVVVGHLAWSAYRVCLSYVFYMALEPYARRLWPGMLVSWVRVFAGRFRDARVGRDVLLGLLFGATIVAVDSGLALVPAALGLPDYGLGAPFWSWESLRGPASAFAAVAGLHVTAVIYYFVGIIVFLALRVVTRSTWISVTAFTLLGAVMFNPGTGAAWPYLLAYGTVVALFWIVLFRAGLLSVMIGFTVQDWIRGVYVTDDVAAWYALPMILVLLVIAALTVWGARAALAGRPLFRDEIQDRLA